MTNARPILEPTQQESVLFYGHAILAARLADGRVVASLRNMCEALQIDRPGQLRRIREDETISDQLLQVTLQTDGGAQALDMLTAWAIPVWLTGIKPSRVAPEKRPAILAFKREAADALYRHFSESQPLLAAPGAIVPAEPMAQPERPAEGAPPRVMADYYRQMAEWIDWQADIEQWRGHVEDRLESLEEVSRLVPELIERLGPVTLSPEHQQTIRAGVKRLHELSGASYGAIYTELGEAFRVAKYSDIPETEWARVAEWFRARIHAQEKRQGRP